MEYGRVILLFRVPLKKPEATHYTDNEEVLSVDMAFIHCFNSFAESINPGNVLRDHGTTNYMW